MLQPTACIICIPPLTLSIASHPLIPEHLTHPQLFRNPVLKATIILLNFIWPPYSCKTPWVLGLKSVLKLALFVKVKMRKNPMEELELAL